MYLTAKKLFDDVRVRINHFPSMFFVLFYHREAVSSCALARHLRSTPLSFTFQKNDFSTIQKNFFHKSRHDELSSSWRIHLHDYHCDRRVLDRATVLHATLPYLKMSARLNSWVLHRKRAVKTEVDTTNCSPCCTVWVHVSSKTTRKQRHSTCSKLQYHSGKEK